MHIAVSSGASLGASAAPPWRVAPHLRRLGLVVLAFALAVTLGAIEGPASVQASASQAAAVKSIAKSHLGKRYVFGATGMSSFDCSGLVYRVYRQAGLLRKIGGSRMGVRAYWSWFRKRGLASRSNPRVGDLVVWGNGAHMGIYIGNGKSISALVNPWGVTKHPVTGFLTSKFTTYLHVRLGGATASTSTPTAVGDRVVRVDSRALNVRRGPSTGHRIKSVVYRGDRLPALQKARDSLGRKWWQVRLSNGSTGWVAGWLTTRIQ